MGFEIQVTTITTGSSSFNLKNSSSFLGRWVFRLEIFGNVEKPDLSPQFYMLAYRLVFLVLNNFV